MVKNLPANAGDTRDVSSIPASGRSPGVESGKPLQHSFLGTLWTEKPGGLQSMGLRRVRQDLATEQRSLLYSRFLLVIYIKYSIVDMSILNSQSIPARILPSTPQPGNHKFVC